MIRNIYTKIIKIKYVALNILLILIIILTFLAAMSRAFSFPLPWSLELVLLLFAWFVFLAASQSSEYRRHLGVDLLTSKFPKKVQLGLSISSHVLCLAFQGFIAVNAFILCVTDNKRVLASLNCSYSWITASLGVGMVFMLFAEIDYLIQDYREILTLRRGDKKWHSSL